MSEVIPEDEDRDDDGAMGDALEDTYGGPGASDDADEVGGIGDEPGAFDD